MLSSRVSWRPSTANAGMKSRVYRATRYPSPLYSGERRGEGLILQKTPLFHFPSFARSPSSLPSPPEYGGEGGCLCAEYTVGIQRCASEGGPANRDNSDTAFAIHRDARMCGFGGGRNASALSHTSQARMPVPPELHR